MNELYDYLKKSVELGASDVFVVAGAPISVKIDGTMHPLDDERLMPDNTMKLISDAYGFAGREKLRLIDIGDDDFSFALSGIARFRVDAYRQRGSYAMVIRIVSFVIPSWQERRIPESIMSLADLTHGMVLFTGTAGSGKSTTQACIIDRINSTRACHIVTLEDPIEFLHRDKKSIVSQREIAIDTRDCASALRSVLRQAPDVILVGEMRDSETIRAAITAAETGHLVIATLHTRGAVNAVDRIIDSFPPEAQYQVRVQLSSVLDTVVSQHLVPALDGSLVPAFEIMKMTGAVRNMIRESKTHMINNAISTGAADGMISMDRYLADMYESGLISRDVALEYADAPDALSRRLK